MDTDVIIAGRGIAGLVVSLLLTRKNIPHLLLDRSPARKQFALGETLPPSALPLLQSLGLLDLFECNSLHRTHGYHSAWGSTAIADHNFFFHTPFQHGLKINKQSLEQHLEDLTSENVRRFEKMTAIHLGEQGVTVELQKDHKPIVLRGKCLVEATGRNRAVLKLLGIGSAEYDELTAYSCHLPRTDHPKIKHGVFVESFEHGWGIVSRLSDEMQVMSLFSRRRVGIHKDLKDYSCWPAILSGTAHLRDFLSAATDIRVVGGDAGSSRATRLAGKCWLAIGDAAIAFDPLSSHGITNAIYTADRAVKAIALHLSDRHEKHFRDYAGSLSAIFATYLGTRYELYQRERRWPEAAFWTR
ncbi:MAG TPA: FAD-dependent monooxygenase [Pyrinomonadaceae bacterium]|nr:FAD-dependent monooxygenase [Pyrinomonadaceae bacterium]